MSGNVPHTIRCMLCLGIAFLFVGAVWGGEEAAPAPAPTPSATPATAHPKPAETVGEIDIIQIIKWGGNIGYFILFLSVLSFTLMIKIGMTQRLGVLAPEKTKKTLDALFKERKIREAIEFCRKDDSLLARIVGAGLSELRSGYAEMEKVMTEVGEEASTRMHQTVGYLSLLASIAPLNGLLGTVWGMVLTFNTIANTEGAANPRTMASSIEMALVTTVLGLLVAIPCVIAFTFFRNRLTRLMLDVSISVDELMSRFKGVRPAPAPTKPQPVAKPAPAAKKPAEAAPEPEEKPAEEKHAAAPAEAVSPSESVKVESAEPAAQATSEIGEAPKPAGETVPTTVVSIPPASETPSAEKSVEEKKSE